MSKSLIMSQAAADDYFCLQVGPHETKEGQV
jgi:hypothetical protein